MPATIAADLAKVILSSPVPRSIEEPRVEIPLQDLPRGIAHVHIHGSVDGTDRLWQPDHVGWVTPLAPEDVEREIERKARMVTRARRHCEELWLVIVNSMMRGAAVELSLEAMNGCYAHPFDRLIWLEPHVPRAIELRGVSSRDDG